MVLQVLYNHIKDKSKVITGKRVHRIDQTPQDGVVTTEDGSKFRGDIIVGADGIHSTTRAEMWRIAREEQPGYIPASEDTGNRP